MFITRTHTRTHTKLLPTVGRAGHYTPFQLTDVEHAGSCFLFVVLGQQANPKLTHTALIINEA